MISCMTMIFTLHFTLNNFCEPQKYEHFLPKMFFQGLLSPHFAKISQKVFHAYQKFPERKIFFPPMGGGGWYTLLATFPFTCTDHQISKVSQIQISLHYQSKFQKNFLTFWDIAFFLLLPF